MGCIKRGVRQGRAKKVERLKKFVIMVSKNKEAPPRPANEEEREFLESAGVVCLNEDEEEIMELFFKTLEFSDVYRVNKGLLKEYLKPFKGDFLRHYEVLSSLCDSLNKEILKDIKK